MRTIFIIMHGAMSYGSESKPKIAFERKEDAEAMLNIFADATRGELKIVEVPLQRAATAPVVEPPHRLFGAGAVPGGVGNVADA